MKAISLPINYSGEPSVPIGIVSHPPPSPLSIPRVPATALISIGFLLTRFLLAVLFAQRTRIRPFHPINATDVAPTGAIVYGLLSRALPNLCFSSAARQGSGCVELLWRVLLTRPGQSPSLLGAGCPLTSFTDHISFQFSAGYK